MVKQLNSQALNLKFVNTNFFYKINTNLQKLEIALLPTAPIKYNWFKTEFHFFLGAVETLVKFALFTAWSVYTIGC